MRDTICVILVLAGRIANYLIIQTCLQLNEKENSQKDYLLIYIILDMLCNTGGHEL